MHLRRVSPVLVLIFLDSIPGSEPNVTNQSRGWNFDIGLCVTNEPRTQQQWCCLLISHTHTHTQTQHTHTHEITHRHTARVDGLVWLCGIYASKG